MMTTIEEMKKAYAVLQSGELLCEVTAASILREAIERKEQTKGVKCHGDACCAGQKPCPTPNACGLAK